MLFFINPVTSLVQNLSQEKALLKAYLGLSESMAKPITNSVGEFSFYYNRFLGYLIWHLENTIAEIEAYTPAPTPEPKQYTPEELEAYDSLFGFTPAPAPVEDTPVEDTITEPAPESITELIAEPQPTETLKARMLACTTRQQLEELKSEIGTETSKEIWELCSIPEKNYIKCISKATDPKKAPAVLGYRFHYTVPITQIKYEAIYLGYYLYGEPVGFADDKRVVLVENEVITCDKADLKPLPNKQQPTLTPEERDRLEQIISLPQPQPEVESSSENPTAEEIAALEFTGLAPAPKHENGSQSGSKPDSQASSEVAEKGDLIEVSDPESGLNGKIVEVEYPIRGGAVCCFWEGRSYCIPKNGYSIFQKNILNSPKV